MWTRRSLIFAGGAFTSGGAGAFAADDGVIVVPMRLSDERFWTEAWINRKGPYRLMLDTGANTYLIAPRLVEEAGLTYATSVNLRGVTGVEHGARSYAAAEVVIGGVLRDREVVFRATHGFDGLIVGAMPLGLLELRPTELDFAESQIRIYDDKAPSTASYQRLDLSAPLEDVSQAGQDAARFRTTPKLTVPVRLDGQTFRLTLDTGAPSPVTLYASTVARKGLWNKYPSWAQADGRGLEDPFKARSVRMAVLQIGDVAMKDPVVHLIDPQMIDAESNADGYMGLETLRRMTFLVDAGSNSLWMKPNGAVGQAFRYNRSGMGLALRDHVLWIARLTPESPAARAGLAVGDVILLPPGATPRAFRHSLTDQPGRVLEFQAARDGKAFPVRLVLKDVI